jgi:hypothetical protein
VPAVREAAETSTRGRGSLQSLRELRDGGWLSAVALAWRVRVVPMHIGVLLPAAGQGAGSELVAFAHRAEELGYDSLWLPEIVGKEVMSTAGWLLASCV